MAMGYEEQQAAKVQLALLETIDPISHDWIEKLEHIKGAVAHHVYEEESDRFLHLRQELSEADQARMTARYQEEIARYASDLRAGTTSVYSQAQSGAASPPIAPLSGGLE
jgi:hypothetical protein